MKKRNIAISFKNKEYASALARALQLEGISANITVSDADLVHSDLPRKSIVITSKEIAAVISEVPDQENQPCGFVLAEDFDPPKQILLKLREDFTEYSDEAIQNVNGKECKIVAVTGSSGGVGITSICEALAEELTVYYGAEICVLSLAEFPDTKGSDNTIDVSKLLYALYCAASPDKTAIEKNMHRNAAESGRRVIAADEYFATDDRGVYHLNYGQSISGLSTAAKNDVKNLLRYLLGTCNFDYVICDIPKERLFESSDILELSFKIVNVERYGERNTERKNFRTFVSERFNDADTKMIRVVNFAEYDEADESNDLSDNIVYAYRDDDSFANDEIRIDGTFGIAIKNIAHSINFC